MKFNNLVLALFSIFASHIKAQGLQSNQNDNNTCTPGKCADCVLKITKSDALIHNCSTCIGSKLTSNYECSGTSTGIDNCLATTFGNSSGTNTTQCAICKENYHLNTNTNNCYSPAEIDNCASEYKASFFGIDMVICAMCKNGFKLTNSTNSTRRILQSFFPMTSCVAGTSISNCYGQGANTTCLLCERGYYLKNSSNVTSCQKRENEVEKMCGDGNSTKINGETYCHSSCNALEGYYAVAGAIRLSNGSIVKAQICEHVELSEDQKRERGFLKGNYFAIFQFGLMSIIFMIIFILKGF